MLTRRIKSERTRTWALSVTHLINCNSFPLRCWFLRSTCVDSVGPTLSHHMLLSRWSIFIQSSDGVSLSRIHNHWSSFLEPKFDLNFLFIRAADDSLNHNENHLTIHYQFKISMQPYSTWMDTTFAKCSSAPWIDQYWEDLLHKGSP